MLACAHCQTPLKAGRRIDARYCDARCRSRALRRRRRGLPVDAYPHGARRGRVPIGTPTRLEQLLGQHAQARLVAELRASAQRLGRAA
jgi:hypothetical protein